MEGSRLDRLRRRKERLAQVVHWITVFVVVLKGMTKLEHGAGYAAFLFLAATLIALGTMFHHRLERRFPYFNVFFFLIEAAVLFLVAWLYQHDGAKALHYVVYISAALYGVAAIVFVIRRRRVQDQAMAAKSDSAVAGRP